MALYRSIVLGALAALSPQDEGGSASPSAAEATGSVSESFVVPSGLVTTLWAESPHLYNPTAIDVDARGRVWVTEAVNYRKWRGRNPGRDHPAGDRVVILEDTDGDGRCDSSKVFVQEERLVSPLGICVVGRDVYVSCSPDLIRYTDLDGDDVPDESEVVLTGFGGRDHDHGLHSVVAAPDGYLYGAVGNAGPHLVTDRSGWRLRSGSLYNGGGPQTADNKPGLVSDDGLLWTGGLIFRVQPDGTDLEILGHNFRNEYEVALDSFGNLFTADNDDDGNASCRTVWVMEGGNYGFFSPDGSRTWQADRRPEQDTETAHWHGDDPGVVPVATINGAGGPTGVAVYEGALLAQWIDGSVLNCDAGAGVVYAHRPRIDGAGITLEPGKLIEARDGEERGSRWFRPSDVAVGVDGAVYVADWYDPGVGGHAMGDKEAYGRILRIAPIDAGRPGPREPTGVLSPAINVRSTALWTAESASEARANDADPRVRARGLQRLAAIGSRPDATVGDGAFFAALRDETDPRVRATRVRSTARDASWERLRRLAGDPDPFVRRATATLLGRREDTDDETLLRLATSLDPNDRIELEAVGLAFRGLEEDLWPMLTESLGDVPSKWSERFAALAWRLHPEAAVPGMLARAMDATLPTAARRRMIDGLAFVATSEAAAAMDRIALSGPADLRPHAAWWSRHRATNTWRAFGLDAGREAGDLSKAERVFSSDLVRAGSIDVDVDVTDAETLWLIVTDAGNGNACDWADWIDPVWSSASGETPLTGVAWLEAEAQWGEVRVNRNAGGGELVFDGERRRGIGTHANSAIAFAVPADVTRFRALAAVDDAGTNQADGKATSVTFEVWVDRPPSRERFLALERKLTDRGAKAREREEAARELAADPEGGLRLVHLAAQGALDESLRAAVSGTIFSNPDLSVRALATEHFDRPGEEAVLPTLDEFLAMDGDPARGRALFFDDRARCGTCHAVVRGDARRGGDIGPELTRIRAKYGPLEVFDAILNPSAGIAFGYDTWLIEDTAGRLYSGFLLADGEALVLKDTRGVRRTIDAGDVAGRWLQELSTMPQGLALGLEPSELADIVAFLAEDPDRAPDEGPLLGDEVVLFDGTSLDGWTHYLADANADPKDVWSIEDRELVCTGNPIGYLRTESDYTSFVLTLEWRFDPELGPGNSGVLLRMTGADKVWPKSIEAQLQHRNAGDIWNIDRFDMDCAPERTRGRHTARVQPSSERPIGEWNRYVITLDGERLTLEVNGVLQNTARWCEEIPGKICLQSEGAAIRFREIRLRPILD